ncbi:MAG TPA: D-2-hydroxyacid dehydrogenase [Ktedonobacteraceae bacterium]|nr:D-2-hydroxyacid dehydrogenase [Ktedonobacteraceae bacterium]
MPDCLKVVSTFAFSAQSREVLGEAAGAEIVCSTNTDEILVRLRDADVLCSYWVPRDWRILAPRLRWLQYSAGGVDDLQPTGILDTGSGVTVTTAVGIHANTVGEYVFGSMLMFNRTWPQMVRLQDRHVWPRSANWYNLGGRELGEQTLGIVGLGSIGRRIAQLGRAFGMRVLATKRSLTDDAYETDVDQLYPRERLHDMLHESDYVVLVVPLTSETEHMIGEAELRAMRPHAYLVNVARGRVIDEQALLRALRSGWIAGAGLDVVEHEPLAAESPLYTLPNVILTPHISGVSVHYEKRLAALFAENLRRYRAGEALRNRYDPERGY